MTAIEINRVVCEECGFAVLRPIVDAPLDKVAEEYFDLQEIVNTGALRAMTPNNAHHSRNRKKKFQRSNWL